MKIYEIGTGYTPIPAKMGAATEIVVEELAKSFQKKGKDVTILDIKADDRLARMIGNRFHEDNSDTKNVMIIGAGAAGLADLKEIKE